MPYIALCEDDPTVDSQALRAREKDAHFAYIAGILGRLLVAGPLQDAGGGEHSASLFVYAVESEGEARQLLENDPYFKAGIYGEVRLRVFVPAAGGWIGGTIW